MELSLSSMERGQGQNVVQKDVYYVECHHVMMEKASPLLQIESKQDSIE